MLLSGVYTILGKRPLKRKAEEVERVDKLHGNLFHYLVSHFGKFNRSMLSSSHHDIDMCSITQYSFALAKNIVIIGSSGAGKSTLARVLSSISDVKVIHLDRLFWQNDWKERTEIPGIELLGNLIAHEEDQWIVEGNYFRFSEFHVNAADTIIFLDLPPLVCFWRLFKRHFEYYKCPRHDIPEGCTDKLTLRRIWKVLTFWFHGRRTIKQILHKYESKHIIRLRSTKKIREFLLLQKQIAGNESNPSDLISATKERILATRRYSSPITFVARELDKSCI